MKNKNMLVLVCGLCMLLMCFGSAWAKENTKVLNGFSYTYQLNDSGEIWITKITPCSNKNISVLQIPSSIDAKKVTKLGNQNDTSDDAASFNIFGLYRSEDDEKIKPDSIVKQVKKIKKIVLPNSITELTPCCLTYIPDGKTINIPQGVTKNLINTYEAKTKWKKFSVSAQNPAYRVKDGMLTSKDGKKLYGFVGPGDSVSVPQGVKRIEAQVLSGIRAKNIYIPASVTKIVSGALKSKTHVKFYVSKKNKHYASTGNCIYSKVSGRLVAISCNTQSLKIPNKVTKIVDVDISGENPKTISIPSSVKSLSDYYGIGETYIFSSKTPPKFGGGFGSKTKFVVPKGAKQAYVNALSQLDTKVKVSEL